MEVTAKKKAPLEASAAGIFAAGIFFIFFCSFFAAIANANALGFIAQISAPRCSFFFLLFFPLFSNTSFALFFFSHFSRQENDPTPPPLLPPSFLPAFPWF